MTTPPGLHGNANLIKTAGWDDAASPTFGRPLANRGGTRGILPPYHFSTLAEPEASRVVWHLLWPIEVVDARSVSRYALNTCRSLISRWALAILELTNSTFDNSKLCALGPPVWMMRSPEPIPSSQWRKSASRFI